MKQQGLRALLSMLLCVVLTITAGCGIVQKSNDNEDENQTTARSNNENNEDSKNVADEDNNADDDRKSSDDDHDEDDNADEDKGSKRKQGKNDDASSEDEIDADAEDDAAEGTVRGGDRSSGDKNDAAGLLGDLFGQSQGKTDSGKVPGMPGGNTGGDADDDDVYEMLTPEQRQLLEDYISGKSEGTGGNGSGADREQYTPGGDAGLVGDWVRGKEDERTGLVPIAVPQSYNGRTHQEVETEARERHAGDSSYFFDWGSSGFVSPNGEWAVYLTSKVDISTSNMTLMLLNLKTDSEDVLYKMTSNRTYIVGWIDDNRVVFWDNGEYIIFDLAKKGDAAFVSFTDPRIVMVGKGMLLMQMAQTGEAIHFVQWNDVTNTSTIKSQGDFTVPPGLTMYGGAVDGDTGVGALLVYEGEGLQMNRGIFVIDLAKRGVAIIDLPTYTGEVYEIGFTKQHELYVQMVDYTSMDYQVEVWKIDTENLDYEVK